LSTISFVTTLPPGGMDLTNVESVVERNEESLTGLAVHGPTGVAFALCVFG